jgi:predicted amidohydrolase
MSTLRVATAQFALRPERDFEAFSEHLSAVVADAARAEAQVVVLPELVTMGLLASLPDAESLSVADVPAAYRSLFPGLTDAFAELVRDLAVRHSMWVLGGSHWRGREDGSFVNTAYFAHPDGTLESQDKLHLTPPEVAIDTSRGDDLLVTSIDGIGVAILICADIQFPELTRHLVLEHDVQLILCPSLTWNSRGVHRVRYGSHARAVENQIFVATSTLIGTCGVPADSPLHAKGRTFIAGPIDRVFGANDGVLATTDGDDEGLAIADLDFGRLAESRANPEPPGLSNLRPDLYRSLSTTRPSTVTI